MYKKNSKIELMFSEQQSKMEPGGLQKAELIHPLLVKQFLNRAKPNSYILIQLLELALHY